MNQAGIRRGCAAIKSAGLTLGINIETVGVSALKNEVPSLANLSLLYEPGAYVPPGVNSLYRYPIVNWYELPKDAFLDAVDTVVIYATKPEDIQAVQHYARLNKRVILLNPSRGVVKPYVEELLGVQMTDDPDYLIWYEDTKTYSIGFGSIV
jgi:hypothetical protein